MLRWDGFSSYYFASSHMEFSASSIRKRFMDDLPLAKMPEGFSMPAKEAILVVCSGLKRRNNNLVRRFLDSQDLLRMIFVQLQQLCTEDFAPFFPEEKVAA